MLRTISILSTAVVSVMVLPVLGEFFISLAREHGWYESPSLKVDAALTRISVVVTSVYFRVALAFFAGLTVGLWAPKFFRIVEKEKPKPKHTLVAASASLAPKDSPTERRIYSEKQIAELMEALQEVFNLMTVVVEEKVVRLQRLISKPWSEAIVSQPDEFVFELLAVDGEMNGDVWQPVNDLVHKKYSYYQGEMYAALNLDNQPSNLPGALRELASAITSLPRPIKIEVARLLSPQIGKFKSELENLGKWHNGSRDIVREMTESLRTKGHTGRRRF